MKKAFLAAAAMAAACLASQAGATEQPKTTIDRFDYEVCTKDGWTVRMSAALGGTLDGKPLHEVFGQALKETARESTAADFNTGRVALDRFLDKLDAAFAGKTESPGIGYGFMAPRAGAPACTPDP